MRIYKYNQFITESTLETDSIEFLKNLKDSFIDERLDKWNSELSEAKPNHDILMAYADDIAVRLEELEVDGDKSLQIYDDLYDIIRKYISKEDVFPYFKESLGKDSMEDLNKLLASLDFISKYDISVHEAIQTIDKIKSMDYKDIEEWRLHIVTNYTKTDLDKFVVELIDRYCSPY